MFQMITWSSEIETRAVNVADLAGAVADSVGRSDEFAELTLAKVKELQSTVNVLVLQMEIVLDGDSE